jgi:signal transduction histidine kinase
MSLVHLRVFTSWPRTRVRYGYKSPSAAGKTPVKRRLAELSAWILDPVGRVADDGVGISAAAIARKADEGHIGMTSMRARVLASGGQFDVRSTSPGTELAISIPLGTARHLTAA